METERYDLIVVGGGSGGIGAALAGARLGLSVLLVEKGDRLGGTAVRGGVHCWEMGAGGTGIPFDMYRRLKRIPEGAGIYSYGRHMSWWDPEKEPYRYPGGERVIDPERRYIDTLQRHGAPGLRHDREFSRRMWHGVPFEPDEYARVAEEMLAETGCCRVLKETAFVEVEAEGGWVRSMRLDDGRIVSGDAYVDSTAGGLLCQGCGCRVLSGQEARATFGEPGAPDQANERRNGATLIYRVTAVDVPGVEPLPEGVPEACWWRETFPVASNNHYPNGDLNVNMLPTMEGEELAGLEYGTAYEECRRRVLAHWHYLQREYEEFRGFRLGWIAPALGVREAPRVVCERMLTENDVRAGFARQRDADLICIADHALDTHGRSTGRQGCSELETPYGVPFRCLIPRGFANLLVACMSAGFSSIAASSCRLSRTMMQLGQAAGTAAALARELGVTRPQVPGEGLRQMLREQHAQVDWPMPEALRAHLLDEDAS